jgi:hypothetical protein
MNRALIKRTFLLTRILLVILSVCLFNPSAQAQELNQNQLNALVQTCLRLIQAEDFRGAALMYHYPAEYTDAELDADLTGVENSLKLFAEEFGPFGEVSKLKRPEIYVDIYATGGTHDYWDQQGDSYKVEMQTSFGQVGDGYLIFHIVDILGTLEVKAIAYGLPVSEKSVRHIRKVGDRMMLIMNKQTARD